MVRTLKIMDINDIKANAGVVFNKLDPRFENVRKNQVEYNRKRLLNSIKDSPYFKLFENAINILQFSYFFVQIKDKMYACGIENCSINEFCKNGNTMHCFLTASFHLYSENCGFYRVSEVLIDEKVIKISSNNSDFREIKHKYSYNLNPYFKYFYLEKDNSVLPIKWGEVYEAHDLSFIYAKVCEKTFDSQIPKYEIKILKNNKCYYSLKDLESVYMGFETPSIVGFVPILSDTWNFYDYLDNKIKYSVPNVGYYKIEIEKYHNLTENILQEFVWWQNRNPLLIFTYSDIKGIIENINRCLKKEIMYWTDAIDKYKNETFELTFKSNFDKISNIAVIYASQFETFKRISVDTYYVRLEANQPEHIEMMYFILRKMKYVFDEKFMEYINSVSILRTAENAKEAWQLIEGAAQISSGIFINDSSNNNYNEFYNLYKAVYNQKIKRKRNNIYNKAIAKGFKLNKWSSEQSLYALIVKYFNDAIYQYQDKWLGLQSLDVYIPSLKIAFEYQGEQHYNASDFFGGEEGLKNNQERDARKRTLCLENDVTLIEWRYDEEITKENLATKLQPFIDELPEENLNYTWEDEKLKLALAKEAKEKEKKSSKPKIPAKVLVQYDIDGNYINHFISQEEASKKTGASKGTISFVINGRQKTSGGYVWRYFDADKIPEKIEKTEITAPEAKEVIQLDLAGNIIKTFPSITSASKICGICTKNIRNVINGKQKTAGGYKWKRKE